MNDCAGRIPFFIHDEEIVFGLIALENWPVSRQFVKEKWGEQAARLISDPITVYGLPRGTIEPGESVEHLAGRESAEEIGYNVTGKPVHDEESGRTIPPYIGKRTDYLVKTIPVDGKRGPYNLTIFVDRIEPRSFVPNPMVDMIEENIVPLKGVRYRQGGILGTVSDMQAACNTYQMLSKQREFDRLPEIKKLIDTQAASMGSQLAGLKDIEQELIAKLRGEGEKVLPSATKRFGFRQSL